MLPPAPERLSTTKGWPSRWPIISETMRAVVSTPPPGGHGTMSLMGCAGYLDASSAEAASGVAANAAAAMAASRPACAQACNFFIVSMTCLLSL
jgi:hypothetical protein